MESKEETSEREPKERDLLEELKGYGHRSTLWTVNRDGDSYYIECPNCHSTEVDKEVMFGCRHCKGYFSLYPEDGFMSIRVLSDLGPISGKSEKVTLVKLKPDAYAHQEIYGRNEGKLGELLKKCPEAKIMTVCRDLHGGRDAHGHGDYNRYVLIPLGPHGADIAEIKQVLKYLMKEDLARKGLRKTTVKGNDKEPSGNIQDG